MESNLYERLAQHSAAAVQGLKPTVSVWNTGGGSDAAGVGGSVAKTLADLCMVVPPLFDTIERQTGMQLLPGLVSRPQHAGLPPPVSSAQAAAWKSFEEGA